MNILLWLKGYVRLHTLTDKNGINKNNERFFNLCKSHNIELYKIHCSSNDTKYYDFDISLNDFKKSLPIARKAYVRFHISNRKGLPFLLQKMFTVKSFIAGMFLFLALIYISGSFVWSISFEGNNFYQDETLYEFMNQCGITYGTKKNTIECEQIEKLVRKNFPYITWVSAELKGSSFRLYIKELSDQIIEVPSTTPSNLISDYNGIISDIVTRAGTPLVKKGDMVNKGDVLISGKVTTYNENNEPITDNFVHADGNIKIYTQVPFSVVIPRLHIEKIYSGNTYKELYFNLFGHKVKIDPYKENYKSFDTVSCSSHFKFYESFYIPIQYNVIFHREYKLSEQFYSNSDLEKLCGEKFNEFLKNFDEKGIQIMDNNVKIDISASEAQMYGFIFVIVETGIQEAVVLEYN